MKKKCMQNCLLVLSTIILAPSLVDAHTGVGHTAGFLHGFGHPLGGLDHILAMAAVGIWAAQISGKAIWVVPATFVSVMIIGGILGMTGIAIPFVEHGIVMSVLILGVLIATAARLPLSLSAAIVGLFAVFHGHAHGAEIPSAVSGFAYSIGFVLATIILHISGIGFGVFFQRIARLQVVRLAGIAIVIGGVSLFIP